MAAREEENGSGNSEEYVYRISTAKEWQVLQKNGSTFGGDLDKSSGFIHLSKLHQVRSTLQNFFLNTTLELYLLQLDAKKDCHYGSPNVCLTPKQLRELSQCMSLLMERKRKIEEALRRTWRSRLKTSLLNAQRECQAFCANFSSKS